MKKQTIIKSLTVGFLTLASVGCGSKSGTYTLSQTGNSYYSQCAAMTLTLTDSSNTVSATGSNGICTENLTGTESGNTITVSSFIITMTGTSSYSYSSMPQCTYTGTLAENGNTFSGTLTSLSTSSYNSSICMPLTVQGTKTN